MADFNMTVTVSGLKLLTDALAGKMVTLTGIHLGSGSYTGNLSAATQLVQEQIALPLDKIIKGDNQITAKSVLQFRTVETGFIWTEVGLFAKESDGPEILYAYGYAGNKGDYIPGADEATLNEKVIRLTMLSSNEANIVAEVDGSTVYASQEDLDDLRESVELSITNITNIIQQVTGVDPSDPDAAPDGSMVVTLTHTKSDTVHTFTGLGERTGLVPCQFKSTAGYTEGDTATIDGTAYTITLASADAPETDLFVSGKSILIDVDTEGKFINFKSGGGLTNGKLALADATEEEVFAGKTFYAGGKELRTGTALSEPITALTSDTIKGKTYYDQTGALKTGTREPFVVKNQIILEDTTWTVPDGVTKIFVRLFGGGGGGGNNGAGGGGHMATGTFSVTPGQEVPVTIGAGGAPYGNGGTTSFGTLLSANGGSQGKTGGGDGGSGGGAYINYSTTKRNGGNGSYGGGGGGAAASGPSYASGNGGNGGIYGGGGGGGSASNGSYSAGTGGTGGEYGGNGGNGGKWASSKGTDGNSGTNTVGLNLDFEGEGKAGNGGTYTGSGGGGGGGYGGNGGSATVSSNYGYGGGGGGGGYGADGGDGTNEGSGGGGGYGGKGGDGNGGAGGGGGYGRNGNGGSGSANGGGGAGIAAGGGMNSNSRGVGGPGICIVTYLE